MFIRQQPSPARTIIGGDNGGGYAVADTFTAGNSLHRPSCRMPRKDIQQRIVGQRHAGPQERFCHVLLQVTRQFFQDRRRSESMFLQRG